MVMKYNICLVRPQGYIHSDAFLELAQLLAYTLEDMGSEVSIKYHTIDTNKRNIILGCHMWNPVSRGKIPENSIIINTEQLYSNNFSFSSQWSDNVVEWARYFETWDYSQRNIDVFFDKGIKDVKHLKIGYHPRLTRITDAPVQDIDILFYGCINERRQRVLDGLEKKGAVVHSVFGVYGEDRDKLISRSKIVLNMHFYDVQIFEIVRAFYLMANQKAIVSEVNKTTAIDASLRAGIFSAPYENLIVACMEILENPELRERQERLGFETISKISQREILEAMLAMPES